ncbi:hypothetical protein A9Q99_18110 [Gammaproteobacteria bacterium 45_16_T64]|nr:hypothetical protein A9Q99_18110 [Gammaproteobacteria bacterium 45_16_T64]
MGRALIVLLLLIMSFFEAMFVYYFEVLQVLFHGEYTESKFADYIDFVRPYSLMIGFSIMVNIGYSIYFTFRDPELIVYSRPRLLGQFMVPVVANIIALSALCSVTFIMCKEYILLILCHGGYT